MESSAIFSTISKLKNTFTTSVPEVTSTRLHNYKVGLDDLHRTRFIEGEVRLDSLDNVSEITNYALGWARCDGVSGDRPACYISTKLGGDGERLNVFPLNSQLKYDEWEADEDLVYQHVKKGDNRYARLMYGIHYDEVFDDELCRPSKIYYYIQLYENDQPLGSPIERAVINISPRFTKDDFYNDSYSHELYQVRMRLLSKQKN